MFICFIFNATEMIQFIRHFWEDFKTGIMNCVRYILYTGDLAIPGFVISRFSTIHCDFRWVEECRSLYRRIHYKGQFVVSGSTAVMPSFKMVKPKTVNNHSLLMGIKSIHYVKEYNNPP